MIQQVKAVLGSSKAYTFIGALPEVDRGITTLLYKITNSGRSFMVRVHSFRLEFAQAVFMDLSFPSISAELRDEVNRKLSPYHFQKALKKINKV